MRELLIGKRNLYSGFLLCGLLLLANKLDGQKAAIGFISMDTIGEYSILGKLSSDFSDFLSEKYEKEASELIDSLNNLYRKYLQDTEQTCGSLEYFEKQQEVIIKISNRVKKLEHGYIQIQTILEKEFNIFVLGQIFRRVQELREVYGIEVLATKPPIVWNQEQGETSSIRAIYLSKVLIEKLNYSEELQKDWQIFKFKLINRMENLRSYH